MEHSDLKILVSESMSEQHSMAGGPNGAPWWLY